MRCRCDNAAVVAIIKSGTSKDALAMHPMRCLFFFTASHQLLLLPSHIPGKENVAADHLSRDALPLFLQLIPPKTYLSGVRYFQIRSGMADPFHGCHMPHLEYTMRGRRVGVRQDYASPLHHPLSG